MDSNIGNFDVSEFEAPKLLSLLRKALEFPRGQYSTNFADLLSDETEAKENYKDGLVALASMIGAFVVIWGLILVYFRCKGGAVGCVSGRAFESSIQEVTNNKLDPNTNGSTDLEEMTSTSKRDDEEGQIMEQTSFPSSLCSSDAASQIDSHIESDMSMSIAEESTESTILVEGKRALRTRIAFLVFACIILACVPLSLAFSFSPVKDTINSSDGVFEETRDVLVQIRAALKTISTASAGIEEILTQTPTNFSDYCPNVNQSDSREVFRVDLAGLSDMISVDYRSFEDAVAENTTKIEKVLRTIENSVDVLEFSFHKAENMVWVIPGLLLGISVVTAFSTFGVVLAWKQDSSLRFQRLLSYGVLPVLVLLAIACWALAIGASVSTAMSADFCLAGTKHGSPDETILEVLSSIGNLPNSTKYKVINAYTNGCIGEEPTLLLVDLEKEAQQRVDGIWRYISTVDAVGRNGIVEECGGQGVHELLSAARNIAKLLTKVRRALDSASDSLVCERINPLYTETIHQNICNEYASASAWGTITFGTIGLALMVLISLRASWRLNIAEEKIYHDESEVAENMIVDEHEEYLRYISRYKHEWQEYNGFDNESIRNSRSVSASEEDPEELHSVSEAMSETTGYTTAQQGEERFTTDEEELTSIASGDISFPSLAVPPTEDSGDGQIVPMPPPLLSPTRNVAKADEDQNQEVMLYDQTTMNAPGNHYLRPAPVTATAVGKNKRSPKVPPPIDTSVPTEQVAAGNAKLAPADSEESTDFSSIGRNAGGGIVSPTSLYWKHQVGLGIEVAMSSVSDSLVVSPNSESGLTSFDLTKTPSPKKGGAPFYEGEKRAMPSSLELPNIPNKALAGGRADRTQPSIPTTPPLVRPRLNKPASVNNKQSPGSVTRSEGSPASTKKLIRAGSAPASFKEDHSKESPSRLRRSGSSSKISEQKQSNVASPALKRLRSASISSGEKKDGSAVKFEDDNTQQSYIEQQVSHFLKTGKSATPKTPPRQSRKKLSELMRKFDTPPSPSTEHEI